MTKLASVLLSIVAVVLVSVAVATPAQNRGGDDLPVLEVDRFRLPSAVALRIPDHGIPDSLRALDGQRVCAYGNVFFLPTDEPVPAFLLCGETRGGRVYAFGARLPYHVLVGVKLREPSSMKAEETVRAEGILRLSPRIINGELDFLYVIEDAVYMRCEHRKGFRSILGIGC